MSRNDELYDVFGTSAVVAKLTSYKYITVFATFVHICESTATEIFNMKKM